MVECARDFMILVDIITFLLGCAVLGVAIYVLVTYSYFSALVSVNTVYISLGVGGALMFVACLGCLASQRGHKGLLCCYLFIVTAALAAQIASVVLVSRFAGQINDQSVLVSGGIAAAADQTLNNAILSTYVACCIGCPTSQGCNNQQEYFNTTNPFCANNNTLICSPVEACAGPNSDGCFVNNAGGKVPPVSIDKGVCDTFKGLRNGTNVPIVGSASSGSCGGGSPEAYINSVVGYFNGVFYWFIVGFGILCGIQALNLMAAIFLLCCTQDRPK
jgi:hypothetical protein